MWWHFWAIMLSILLLSIAVLCCVVACATRCFHPQSTHSPTVRDRYIMKNGELSWREGEPPPPLEDALKRQQWLGV